MKKKKETLRHYICTKMSYRMLHFLLKRNLLGEYIDICVKLDKMYGWYSHKSVWGKDDSVNYSIYIEALATSLANDAIRKNRVFENDEVLVKWCNILTEYQKYIENYYKKLECLPLSARLSPRYY